MGQRILCFFRHLCIAGVACALLAHCRGGTIDGDSGVLDGRANDTDTPDADTPDARLDGGRLDGDARDSAGDPTEDSAQQDGSPDSTLPCNYPIGPYAFDVSETVGPMTWQNATAGPDQPQGQASLEAFFCDPSIHSVFIQVATLTCPNCRDRIRDIAGLQDHWEQTGAQWIFLVNGASPAQADEYVDGLGVDFGYRSNDEDNVPAPYAIVNSPLFEGVPWTAVIRTSDMTLYAEEPEDRYLDIVQIASDLANP